MASELVTLVITTKQESKYEFPDMPQSSLDPLIRHIELDRKQEQCIFVNVSAATLILPRRIVKSLAYGGEVKWTNPEE